MEETTIETDTDPVLEGGVNGKDIKQKKPKDFLRLFFYRILNLIERSLQLIDQVQLQQQQFHHKVTFLHFLPNL